MNNPRKQALKRSDLKYNPRLRVKGKAPHAFRYRCSRSYRSSGRVH